MELALETDTYMPNVDDMGNYVDKIPHSSVLKKGIICPCSTKKYAGSFLTHTKSQCHQKWLASLNTNKANYYVENKKLEEIIKPQRLIIAKNEQDLQNKMLTIDYLTGQLHKSGSKNTIPVNLEDLLEFD